MFRIWEANKIFPLVSNNT